MAKFSSQSEDPGKRENELTWGRYSCPLGCTCKGLNNEKQRRNFSDGKIEAEIWFLKMLERKKKWVEAMQKRRGPDKPLSLSWNSWSAQPIRKPETDLTPLHLDDLPIIYLPSGSKQNLIQKKIASFRASALFETFGIQYKINKHNRK